MQGRLQRLNFFGLDIIDFALNAEPRKVSVHQARVGAIISYTIAQPPSDVTVQWKAFSDSAAYVQTAVLIGNERPKRFIFEKATPVYTWQGDLSEKPLSPVRSNGKSASDGSAESQQRDVFEKLLRNIYAAFDFQTDEAVYDALQTSVAGNLLREMYLKVKRSLILAEQGGTLSHVTKVEVVSAESMKDSGSNRWRVTWRVMGTSEHWGHVHARESEYRAMIGLKEVDSCWKIDRFQLEDEKRIRFETSIRGDDSNK